MLQSNAASLAESKSENISTIASLKSKSGPIAHMMFVWVVRGPLPRLNVYLHRSRCISSVSVRFADWHVPFQLFSLCLQLRDDR